CDRAPQKHPIVIEHAIQTTTPRARILFGPGISEEMQLKPLPGRRWFAARGAALVLSAGLIGCGASGGSDASSSNGPDAQIDQSHVAVDIVTVTCSGGCADVQAVATGGQPPYS